MNVKQPFLVAIMLEGLRYGGGLEGMKAFVKQLRQNNALILDTETTVLDCRAELLQIGIVSLEGEPLFNS